MQLTGNDIGVLIKLAIRESNNSWSYHSLADELYMSSALPHRAIQRATVARLWDPHGKRPIRHTLEEFLIHGVKYAYPAEIGPESRGVATLFEVPGIDHNLAETRQVYVWAHPKGGIRGASVTPLFKTAPEAAMKDERLHQALALIDAIRIGRKREQALAADMLKRLLNHENR
jgi:hypothetical protein